ncbi:MFS transporter [Streptococcus parauberis]|uniref:Transporter, major facilitator family protein n=3 Tax=Lactobacillales TaxID=186826 RepID=F1Z1Z0_9STRE|nr:MFS transporter [Streptococcus parauberis]EGE53127.1 transporter, major facilitator family protein [Streptococcus parauberis NCFD 2020]MDT2731759.1 MFS transporter [Streptococcus parauberis]PIA83099.1 putative cyanate transporter [Streptococcus parauberis]PIO78430.1 putative cyanate transporter [Streptococcus parauberis]PNY20120.1 putative cyanate transporter [Streptococcus parauberis]
MKDKLSTKLSILSISIFLMSHLAIAPAIPKLFELYHGQNPHIGLASVESLVTIPAMMITIFVILSNLVVAKIGKKKTIQLGLIFILISGLVSFITTNFTIVLICRLLLGIGIGLYNALSISIISDYYEGETRANMIGFRTATLNIGKALTTFIVGLALLIGVNYTYLVYLLVIPVYFFFTKIVPESDKEILPLKSATVFDKKAILLMLVTFFVGISYIGATIKLPTLLVSHYGYSSFFASNLLSLLAFSGIFVGLVFGQLTKVLSEKTMLVMILLMGIGNFILTLSNHKFVFFLAAFLIGASFVGTMSSVFNYIAKYYSREHINFVTSLAITAGNIGVILTPVILTKLPAAFHMEAFITPFYITSALMFITSLVYLALPKK